MKTRQQSCSKWRKGKVGKDGAENKSGTVCNDAVTREQFQLGIVRCHARRILVYIKTNCCSLRWHGQTPHRSNGCPPLAGLPLVVHPPPLPLQRILQSGSMSCGDAMHRNRNEWTTITWCSNHFECIRQCE